jgi:hypothetical protein
MGLKPKMQVWRLSPRASAQYQLAESLSNRDSMFSTSSSSFSEKARVQETLERKNMDPLRTPFIDFESKALPGTPGSMVTTPREFYRGDSDDETIRKPPGGPRSDNSSLRLPSTTSRAKHFSLPLIPDVQGRTTLRRSSSEAAKVKKTCEGGNVYMPGPIVLEEKMDDMMDLFDESVTEPKGKRFSDMIALDSVVCYFQDLGVVAESSEECLDRYWVPDKRAGRRKPIPPALAHAHTVAPSARGAFFPRTMGRQVEARRLPPSPETPGRRRLRSLLRSSRAVL